MTTIDPQKGEARNSPVDLIRTSDLSRLIWISVFSPRIFDRTVHFISGYLAAVAGQVGRAAFGDELVEFAALERDKRSFGELALGSCGQFRIWGPNRAAKFI